MRVCWISAGGVERHAAEELEALLEREDGFVWVDIPECDEPAARILSEVFGCHPLAVRDCRQPGHVPKVHAYANHLFVVLHAPELGEPGQVYRREFNQFIGRRYLVTVHERPDAVPLDSELIETRAVLGRIEAGRFRPGSPAELSYAIVTRLAGRMEALVWDLASKVAALEQGAMKGQASEAETILEEMFRLRHELLIVETIAGQNHVVYARTLALAARFVPPGERPFVEDLLDQFERVRSLCVGQREFLQGVLDFSHTRSATKMDIATGRLALITAVVLPISVISSIYGMNLFVVEQTMLDHLLLVLGAMAILTLGMLGWAKRQGWW